MIPKIIHYCWFGGNDLTDEVKKYIATWRKYCPDYKIIEWNEQNFDINCNEYAKEAYEAKKWAFVSDYARLKVLYEYGGIYMDTDVEVVKSFDDLLKCKAFMCFENDKSVSIGTLGVLRKSLLIKDFLLAYEDRHFKKVNGCYDTTTNLKIVTDILVRKYSLNTNGKLQVLNDIYIYPMEYFIAKEYKSGLIKKTQSTYAIHHYKGSWLSKQEKDLQKVRRKYYNNLIFLPDSRIKNKVAILLATMKLEGMGGVFRLIKKKLC